MVCPVTHSFFLYGGVHGLSAVTQTLVSGQQISSLAQWCLPVQKTPGLVGLRHLSASGQQYSSASQTDGGVQSAPGSTQIFVRGQHTCVPVHAVASFSQLTLVGVKHFLASGQQYSVALQTEEGEGPGEGVGPSAAGSKFP